MFQIAELIKHYWGAMAATLAACGLVLSGIQYYAKAETIRMINVEMVKPLEKQNEKIEDLNTKLFDLQRDMDKQSGKLQGMENQLDMIIQLLNSERTREKK